MLGEVYPLILPIVAVLGSLGALMIFSSDKEKGVYEYLIAYGVDPSTIFWSVIVATIGIVALVLAVSLVVTIGALAVTGGALSVGFGELILFYTIPLSYRRDDVHEHGRHDMVPAHHQGRGGQQPRRDSADTGHRASPRRPPRRSPAPAQETSYTSSGGSRWR